MPVATCRVPALIVILSLLLVQLPPNLFAQSAPLSAEQLDQLLAPIALYPDSLLAQITTASTNPQEILDVDNWLSNNPGLSGEQLDDAAQQQGFDPAFLALVQFPSVLQMMAENIDDYAAIGQEVTTDQAGVSASIQRLRAQAYSSGALRTTSQQTVAVQQGPQPIYVIQPANPQVVYVPQYNPTVVYAAPSTGAVVATSLISFGVGIGIGALIANNQPWGWGGWGWNWGGRTIYYNHNTWGGWHGGYRPPNYWYRPRPVQWNTRPGYGGNWNYRPPNYRPPAPVNRPHPVQPGYWQQTGLQSTAATAWESSAASRESARIQPAAEQFSSGSGASAQPWPRTTLTAVHARAAPDAAIAAPTKCESAIAATAKPGAFSKASCSGASKWQSTAVTTA